MKKLLLSAAATLLLFGATMAQVAINTDGSQPDASAVLDVKATDAGILVPRMTLAQRDAIASPATGLMVFQTDNTPGFYYYNGSVWTAVGNDVPQDLSYNAMTNSIDITGGMNAILPVANPATDGLVPAIPNNNFTFFRGDGAWATPAGDNLGNHTATQLLDMSQNQLINVGTLRMGLPQSTNKICGTGHAGGAIEIRTDLATADRYLRLGMNDNSDVFWPVLTVHNNMNVGIGTATPQVSAELEVNSTSRGFLPPRMTEAQMNAIAGPAEGLMVYCTDCTPKAMYYYDGTDWVSSQCVITVSATGRIWMDRNLGADRVATSSTDAQAYGDLYQWGRLTDGHQLRTSGTTTTFSSGDVPGHGNFILSAATPYDWRSPANDNLWQGTGGINNPCPSGYRLPTETEWNNERLSWSSIDAAGAFASPLKLPVAGYRHHSNGSLSSVGAYGYYWSSTVYSTLARTLGFASSGAGIANSGRADGYSVRCVKD